MIAVRDNPLSSPIAWPSWTVWREGRRRPEAVWLRPLGRPPSAFWCVTCWGNGRIYVMAPNGEGPIPRHPCPCCAGSGRTG